MLAATTLGVFFVFSLIGIPIAIALALSAIIPLLLFSNVTMAVVIQKFFASTDSYGLMAIPFFMIAGGLLDKGGISKRLVDLANALIGWMPGGLAVVVFLASAFFSAITGSAVATVVAIGSIMVPSMLKEGYDLKFTLASIASAGYLGVVFPPSIPLILYGLSTGVSVGDLFLGGIIPGILLTVGMAVYAGIWGFRHRKELRKRKFSWSELKSAFAKSIWAMIMPLIILGGIYGGVFTPTEAAGVAVLYGLFIGFVVYRELDLKLLFRIMRSAIISSGMIMFICATASAFAYVLALNSIPSLVATWMIAVCDGTFQFWALVTIFLLFVGMVMDTPPAILILAPLLAPVATQFGIDPVVFGVVVNVNLAIGIATPPVGTTLFIAAGLAKAKASVVINTHMWLYCVVSILIMILLMIFPKIILLIPELAK
jgi:C4-dicarboxylate transporter DctM subunit